MTNKIYTIDEIKQIVKTIAKKHSIERIYLFGSYARNQANSNSDLDFIIDSRNITSLFQLGGIYNDFETAFDKKIDLLIEGNISPEFNYNILDEEMLLYAG